MKAAALSAAGVLMLAGLQITTAAPFNATAVAKPIAKRQCQAPTTTSVPVPPTETTAPPTETSAPPATETPAPPATETPVPPPTETSAPPAPTSDPGSGGGAGGGGVKGLKKHALIVRALLPSP